MKIRTVRKPRRRGYAGVLCSVIAAVLATIVGCYTVPITGRTTFVPISMSEEMQMGAQAFRDARSEHKVSNDNALKTRVERVGRRIAAVSEYPDWDWEFVVFDAPDTPNAWALPGGKVAVYSGLMPLIDSDGELATVLAHEVGHVVARHGAERMSQQMIVAAGAGVVAATAPEERVETANVAYGIGSQLFVMLPYSRKQEYEADRIGLTYMARAGYDPREALSLWTKFKEMSGGSSVPEFLSTHPADEKRLEQLRGHMPGAREEYRAAQKK